MGLLHLQCCFGDRLLQPLRQNKENLDYKKSSLRCVMAGEDVGLIFVDSSVGAFLSRPCFLLSPEAAPVIKHGAKSMMG